jgi:hypothetical protein
VKVQSLSGTSTAWQSFNLDLDALAAANSLSLSSTFIVKFQQYDNSPITSDGFAFDEISVTGSGGGGWQVITSDNFESGMGNYTDGGADMSRYTGGTYAYQGSAAADIQDNSGVPSSFYHTADHNVTGYNTLEVDFYFVMVSMETNEDFFVQYYNGSAWQTVATFARAGSIQNNVFYHATVTIPRTTYNFPTNAQIRFMCDASADNDDVYIDQIEFRGTTAALGLSFAKASEASSADEALHESFELKQNYPNPFNPATTIAFSLPQESDVSIKIYDVTGSLVRTMVNDNRVAGEYSVVWNGQNDKGVRVSSGVYIYRIEAGNFMQTRRMVVLK